MSRRRNRASSPRALGPASADVPMASSNPSVNCVKAPASRAASDKRNDWYSPSSDCAKTRISESSAASRMSVTMASATVPTRCW